MKRTNVDERDARRLAQIMIYRYGQDDLVGVERQLTSIYALGNEDAVSKAKLVMALDELRGQQVAGARYILQRVEAYTDSWEIARTQFADPSLVIDHKTGVATER